MSSWNNSTSITQFGTSQYCLALFPDKTRSRWKAGLGLYMWCGAQAGLSRHGFVGVRADSARLPRSHTARHGTARRGVGVGEACALCCAVLCCGRQCSGGLTSAADRPIVSHASSAPISTACTRRGGWALRGGARDGSPDRRPRARRREGTAWERRTSPDHDDLDRAEEQPHRHHTHKSGGEERERETRKKESKEGTKKTEIKHVCILPSS